MKKNAFVELFFKNAGYFAVAFISIAYIASSLILISKTGRTVGEILATGALSMIVGILINGIFRSLGIQKGEGDERTVATENLHSKTVDEIVPYIDKLDSYCEEETKKATERIRRKMLARECLSYEECFDEKGVSREFTSDKNAKKRYKKRYKIYKKAVNLSIKPLTSSNLTAEGVNADDPFNFGKTKKQYTAGHNTTDLVIRAAMAIIFGYFGVSLVTKVDVATIIWNTLQIVMYIAGGIMQMYMSYLWVVNDYRHNKIRKIDILQKFKLLMEGQTPASAEEQSDSSNRDVLMRELWEGKKSREEIANGECDN